MNNHISIQEAAAKTGKSIATITRLAREHKNTKHVKIQGKKYLISTTLISQYYSITNQNDETIRAKDETIEVLKSQLKTKDEQISQLHNTIGSLTERLRESNILVKNTQGILPAPIAPQDSPPVHIQQTNQVHSEIIRLSQAGVPYAEIARKLNSLGYLNRFGRAFTKNAVQKKIERLRKNGKM